MTKGTNRFIWTMNEHFWRVQTMRKPFYDHLKLVLLIEFRLNSTVNLFQDDTYVACWWGRTPTRMGIFIGA